MLDLFILLFTTEIDSHVYCLFITELEFALFISKERRQFALYHLHSAWPAELVHG